MLRYECDNCRQLKEADEAWILGFAAERIGALSARREVNIVSTWDDNRAVQRLAVHFCSDQCRAEYMEAFFGEEATPAIEEIEVVPSENKVIAKVPATVVRPTKRNVKKRRAA
jgi:hypothetical protein